MEVTAEEQRGVRAAVDKLCIVLVTIVSQCEARIRIEVVWAMKGYRFGRKRAT